MKKWKKSKTSAILLTMLIMTAMSQGVHASDILQTDYFTLKFYNEGEQYNTSDPSSTSTYTLADWQKTSVGESAEYWSKLLKQGQGNKNIVISVGTYDDNNAYCDSDINSYDGNMMGDIEAFYKGYTVENSTIVIRTGKAMLPPTQLEQENYSPLWQQGSIPMYPTLVHELGHGVGISIGDDIQKSADHYSFGSGNFMYRDNLYDWRGVKAQAGMEITYDENKIDVPRNDTKFSLVSDSTENDAANFAAPYFKGEHVTNLLDGALLQVYNANGFLMEQRVPGVQINGVELDRNPDGTIVADSMELELSHLELRNGLMSHQFYRNYSTLMEAELAVVQDIGYDIDVRSLFGRSVYGDNLTIVNTRGFSARNESGTGYLANTASVVPYGIGLHIYGSYNDITQAADILNAGIAGVGVRIDGVDNKVTAGSGTLITGNGYNGVGILTAFGKNHELNLAPGSIVTATGEHGVGLLFDFGQNVIGADYASRASFAAVSMADMVDAAKVEVDGPLVNNVNINGTVIGSDAAVKISANAYVKNINVGTGAQLFGDIMNNWVYDNEDIVYPEGTIINDADVSGTPYAGMARQYVGDEELVTKLNFTGKDLNYAGNIIGDKNTRLTVTGDLKYVGTAAVLSVEVAEGATLSGNNSYILPDTNGTYQFNYETWNYDENDETNHGEVVNHTLNNVGMFTNKGTVTTVGGAVDIKGDVVSTGLFNLYGGDINVDGDFQTSGNIGLATNQGVLAGGVHVTGFATITDSKLTPNANFAPLFNQEYTYLVADQGITAPSIDSYALNSLVHIKTVNDNDNLTFTAEKNSTLLAEATRNHHVIGLENQLDHWTDAIYLLNNLTPEQVNTKAGLTNLYYKDAETLAAGLTNMKAISRNSIEIANPLTALTNHSVLDRLNNYQLSNLNGGSAIQLPHRAEINNSASVSSVSANVPNSLDTADNLWGSMFRGQDTRDLGNTNSNTFGGVLGYDHEVHLTDRVGGFVSYGKSSYGGDGISSDSHDWRLGAYGSHSNGDWTYQGILSYGTNRYDTRHYVLGDRYDSKYDMKVWDVMAKVIYNVPSAKTKTWQIMPYGQLEYTHGSRDSYTEQGTGTFRQQIESKNYNTTTAEVGLGLQRKLGKIGHWGGSVGYKRVLSGADHYLRGSFIGSQGIADTGFSLKSSEDKNYFTYSLGANGQLSSCWTLEGKVEGEKSAHNHDEVYSVTAKYSF